MVWLRTNVGASGFQFSFTPIGGWEVGYRKNKMRVVLNSGDDIGGGTLFANSFSIYDSEENQIGTSGSFSFSDWNETLELFIDLDFTGTGDIAEFRIESFLYSDGPIISDIEFFDE